ncbi:MAG: hypothetical protein D3924_04375 [Candidatus Electrothrix sp. AR4]|nr:hypothetical protein [Candidatus Electrothrix sp. AR4]
MKNDNKRQFSRINIQWDVHLDFGLREYRHFADNLSLRGIYVEGHFNHFIGDICTIRLRYSEFVEVNAVGSIARINDAGMALEFISMKLESFFFLQTALLCEAGDPVIFGTEFVKNIMFELDDDLVFFEEPGLTNSIEYEDKFDIF